MKKQKLIASVAIITMAMSLFTGCAVKMGVPEVRDGRFDFSVTYEVNGEEQTYTGVYVCKYEGVSVALDGKGRSWNGYIENGRPDGMVEIQNNDDGKIYIDFKFNPLYFMSDPNSVIFEIPEPELILVYHSEDPDFVHFSQEVDFLADYGVQLISYTYSDPVENSFEEKWVLGNFEMGIN